MKRKYRLFLFVIFFILIVVLGTQLGKNSKLNNNVVTSATPNTAITPTPLSTANPDQIQDETYTIKRGDTLYSIGKHYNIQWPAIAAYNDLAETTQLIEGQKIKIPTSNQANTLQTKTYSVITTTEEKQSLEAAQNFANSGSDALSYRLDPIQVVQKSLLLLRFQFSASDLFVLRAVDKAAGTAIVEVTHLGKLYTVSLVQPLIKGDKGVWTPTSVKY